MQFGDIICRLEPNLGPNMFSNSGTGRGLSSHALLCQCPCMELSHWTHRAGITSDRSAPIGHIGHPSVIFSKCPTHLYDVYGWPTGTPPLRDIAKLCISKLPRAMKQVNTFSRRLTPNQAIQSTKELPGLSPRGFQTLSIFWVYILADFSPKLSIFLGIF